MTRKRLRELESLLRECEEDEKRLVREQERAARISQTLGAFSLFGEDREAENRERLAAVLRLRAEEAAEVREWIEQLPDAIARRAFKLRFLDKLRWDEIARRMGYISESGPRMLCARVLDEEE